MVNSSFLGIWHHKLFQKLEAVAWRYSAKGTFLKIYQNSLENTSARVSFLIKLLSEVCKFIKNETLTQVFSCEFWEIFKNSFLYRTPPVAAFRKLPIFIKKLNHFGLSYLRANSCQLLGLDKITLFFICMVAGVIWELFY